MSGDAKIVLIETLFKSSMVAVRTMRDRIITLTMEIQDSIYDRLIAESRGNLVRKTCSNTRVLWL